MPELRDGTTTSDLRLDRLIEFDEQSREHPIRAIVPQTVRARGWALNTWLDQGREGACVSFAWHHEAAAVPAIARGLTDAIARERYFTIQRRDPWPGGAYPGATPFYEGTSVLTGAKVMQELGYFQAYKWAFSIDDVMRALSHEGPVVFGLPWKDSMFEPRPSGLLDCSGTTQGGHAILGRGLSLKPRLKGEANKGPLIRLHNSWGKDWGPATMPGDAYITAADLEQLLKADGECCVPVNRRVPKTGA